MKKFLLKDKTGEIIHHTKAVDKKTAIEYFSMKKGIPEKALIEIYIIEKQ